MFHKSFASRLTTALSTLGFVAAIALAAGCGSSESPAVAAPQLSVPGNAVAQNDQPAMVNMPRNEAAPASESPRISVTAEQDDLNAVIKDVNANVAAWQQGKSFDFKPAVRHIVGWLDEGLDQRSFGMSREVAQISIMTGSYDTAKQLYLALAKAGAKSDNPRLAMAAKEIAGTGLGQLDLLGTKPKIEGNVFGQSKLDWNKYRGKVVLIDFWATWCGPCRAELPNVRKVYDKLHGDGFEVLGISLDDDKDRLAEFLDKEKLPWPILFGDTPEEPGPQSLAKAFSVDGIPATYLVARDGKIVSISARGEGLETQVKKLLAERK
jgi:thiol-disulfide isomerase/thioredoxin